MGTYGTTHIRKKSKVIDFTDSHDGYFSFMGKMNLFSIKYVSDTQLVKLFNKFNAEQTDGEITPSQREIENAIFQVDKDTKSNPEAKKWIKDALGDSIRASISGFAPLLYLNFNPGFTDSEIPSYIIDLDTKEFIYTNGSYNTLFKIPFDVIRNTSDAVLNYLSDTEGNDFELLKKSKYEELSEKFQELDEEKLSTAQLKKLVKIQYAIQKEINAVLALDPTVVVAAQEADEKDKADKYAQYLASRQDIKTLDIALTDEDVGGFSIRSANSLTPIVLRKIVFFLQKFIEKNPEAKFLLETTEWGIAEDYSSGGFRIFTPHKLKDEALYNEFVSILETHFKIGMNIFSSSGKWDSSIKENDFFTSGTVAGPQPSLFTLEKAKQMEPGWSDIEKYADAMLGYHIFYAETKEIILKAKFEHLNQNIFWSYVAVLNQDIELFNKVYPGTQEALVAVDTKTNKMVKTTLLKSLADSMQMNELLNVENTPGFIDNLKSHGFFNDLKDQMNQAETKKYLSTVRKLKK